MTLDWISLLALLGIIVLSRRERVNVGILAIGLAWVIGFYGAGIPLSAIFNAFPLSLFLILFGVTFFFGLAQVNGTLNKVTHLLLLCPSRLRLAEADAHGRTLLLPVIFFILALVLAAMGPGNIGAVALLAPLALAIAARTGISTFFMTVMLINGANAGTFSPFSPTGIIANGLIARLGLAMNPWTQVFLPSLLAQSFIALGCYAVLVLRMRQGQAEPHYIREIAHLREPFSRSQIITMFAIAFFILGVIMFKADIGFLAIGLSALMLLGGASDAKAAILTVPWNIIMMVCGVSMFINVMGKTGGLDLVTGLLAKISHPASATGILAFLTGVLSSYSSSSGVVMPAFIPMVPGLIEKIGGGHPVALVASINVGSHVVDVSPLSTLGALCLASAAKDENKARLFHQLLIFGLSMSVAGAGICYLFFGVLGRWFWG